MYYVYILIHNKLGYKYVLYIGGVTFEPSSIGDVLAPAYIRTRRSLEVRPRRGRADILYLPMHASPDALDVRVARKRRAIAAMWGDAGSSR